MEILYARQATPKNIQVSYQTETAAMQPLRKSVYDRLCLPNFFNRPLKTDKMDDCWNS